MANDFAIKLSNVTKKYILHHEKPTLAENIFGKSWNQDFTALDDISLEIKKGEKVGIIGSNGSGKTTLLKIITGITKATSGNVETQGRLVSLIDVEAGFNADMTGEENIYLNSLIVGMERREVKKKFDKIIEFADIGKFIDSPLYTYSEGMKLRLGFSVIIHTNPDILILDEAIAAGDANFRNKIEGRIFDFLKSDKTVVVVSHWFDFLEENCKKGIWIHKSKLKKVASIKDVVGEYKNEFGH